MYTSCDTIAISYSDHVTEFTNYSTKYTATTGTDLRMAIKDARALPGEAQRDAAHSVLRKELVELKDNSLIVWQQLSSFIRDAYSKEVYQNQLNAAGHGYYSSAQNEDWDDVKGLMEDGANYITEHSAVLTADGGMPAGFEVVFGNAQEAFELKYDAFLQALEASKLATDKKLSANNAIYREAMRICEDGKRIFRKDAAIREQFTFETVLSLVRANTEKHGISGVVKDSVTGSVIGQADMLLEKLLADGTYALVEAKPTDNAAEYKFLVKNGTYRLTASKVGYVSKVEIVEVDGGPKIVDFLLDAEVA